MPGQGFPGREKGMCLCPAARRIWENQGIWSPKNKEKRPVREEGGDRQKPCYVGLIGSVDFIMSLRSHLLGGLSGLVKISLCFFARKEFAFHGELIENVLRGVVVKSPIFFNCTIQRQICNQQIASMGVYRCTHNI